MQNSAYYGIPFIQFHPQENDSMASEVRIVSYGWGGSDEKGVVFQFLLVRRCTHLVTFFQLYM